MGLYERVMAARAAKRAPVELAWPVGPGAVPLGDRFTGHDLAEFAPEEYGDYIATSNEIYAVAAKRARLLSGLPLRLYRGAGPDRMEITTGPILDLLNHINPFWTPRRLARMDELSMCVYGHTAWAIEREAGRPTEIWWLKPSRLRPVPHERDYLAGFLYEPIIGGEPIPFGPDEIVWFRYPNPLDEFAPLSPLAAARLAADTGSAMMTSNRNLFRDGLQMGGMIVPAADKVTFSEKQAAELEHLLERRWKGVDKAHRWAVLRYEAQLKGLGITPRDAEFLGGLNLSLRQICNAYGMQSALLNDLEHATLANVRDLERHEWEATLKPDSQLRADEITEQFLPMFGRDALLRAEFDYTAVSALQEAASESWARERQAIEVGALTVNEWRKTKGLPPVAWGDVYWAPVNKSAVTDAASHPEGDTTPPQPPASTGEGQAEGEGQEDGGEEEGEMRRLSHLDARAFLTAAFNGGPN